MAAATDVATAGVARPRRHRNLRPVVLAGIVALVGVLIAAAFAVRAWLTSTPKPIGVAEVVDTYREQSTSVPGAEASMMPVPGVYAYTTSGEESVDALGGDAHRYPPETAMTVEAEGCGFRVTWMPLEGRVESSLLCPEGGGLALVSSTTAHEFFRMSETEEFTCDPGAWWLPPPGITAWTATCQTSDRVSTRSGRLVGMEPVDIAGNPRTAVHVRYDDVLSEGSTGTTTSDLWLDPRTGLVLGQRQVAETRNESAIGTVVFRERIDMSVRSVTPQV